MVMSMLQRKKIKMTVPTLRVQKLGTLGFNKTLMIQKSASRKVLENLRAQNLEKNTGYLFLVEHDPVYTVGIRNKQYNEDEKKFKDIGADFVKTDRGGLITFHGPGQLVAYPVIHLGFFSQKKSIKWYVKQLENSVIDVCYHFKLKANTSDNVGVWIKDSKVAAIGIHASRYVTTHGVALNCNVDLGWFSHIVPCGIPDKGVTSLSKELNRNVTVEETIPVFLNCFQKHFPCNFEYVS
ncbi:putative lipoyltransferase 2, mitochondrial [Uloborus diversus]|uniref:putative lipoyltransferase 2, mitochondrial n=1 Tax=Uloborus diversus TaxID=327109 RepID=UPI00240A4143|nr:putative lipoyltransferase 2, mitochondrial [Uloborus diversus]